MRRRLYIVLLLLCSCLCAIRADETQVTGLHCGQTVRITATPEPGYKFVSWSDGDTSNPREIEISEAMEIEAIFEPACVPDTVIPVVSLYGQLLVVDQAALRERGYVIDDKDLDWYRVVGDIDDILSTAPDDEQVASGAYINRTRVPDGTYYVQTVLSEDEECPHVLRSDTFLVASMGIEDVPIDDVPSGKFLQDYHLYIRTREHIYDAQGHCVR